jgi:hypothetical protein
MKTKSILVLLVTLIIGFFLGWLSSSIVMNRKVKEIRAYSSYEGIRSSVFSRIHPTPEQRRKIEPVVEKFSRQNLELRKKYMKEFFEVRDEFHRELFPLLTDEQIQNIEKARHQAPAFRGRGHSPHYKSRPSDSLGRGPGPHFKNRHPDVP